MIMVCFPLPLRAADSTVPGGLGGAGGGEHGHPGLPPRGGESVPGARQGGDPRGLCHGRHGLAEHGGQLPNSLLLLVTAASCANLLHLSPLAPVFFFSANHRKVKKIKPTIQPDRRTPGSRLQTCVTPPSLTSLQKHTTWCRTRATSADPPSGSCNNEVALVCVCGLYVELLVPLLARVAHNRILYLYPLKT